MKEFDLEKLERQNVFTQQEDFFEEMQNKVLEQIPARKEGKVIKMNWVYTAAAAIALIFGFTFFITSAPADEPAIEQNVTAKNNIVKVSVDNVAPSEEVVALKVLEEDLTSVENDHQKNKTERKTNTTAKTVKFANQKEQGKVKNSDLQVDQILSNFTRAELADLSQNSEQDIYLDLYN